MLKKALSLSLGLSLLFSFMPAKATTVIYDGHYLASDTQVTEDDGSTDLIRQKIFYSKKRKAYAGFGGNMSLVSPAIDWFMNKTTKVCPVKAEKDGGDVLSILMIFNDGRIILHCTYDGKVYEIDLTGTAALGTGGKAAKEAIFFGCDARQAVIIASKFDVNTNSNVVYFDVKNHSTELKTYSLDDFKKEAE
jgi:ATP-dependent protease HslVU (ClpYQ) peptidase subunit